MATQIATAWPPTSAYGTPALRNAPQILSSRPVTSSNAMRCRLHGSAEISGTVDMTMVRGRRLAHPYADPAAIGSGAAGASPVLPLKQSCFLSPTSFTAIVIKFTFLNSPLSNSSESGSSTKFSIATTQRTGAEIEVAAPS